MSEIQKPQEGPTPPSLVWVEKLASNAEDQATVYLVGAGPGDPDLLTLRAAELIRTADAVVYDYLVEESILRMCRGDAELIDVGKRPSRPMSQDRVTEVLLGAAKRHKSVVRLKGGDPFVFGRGGEEALALIGQGIRFEVVPGVTSAIAVPTYAGIPVTHRGIASSFTVLAGHSKDAGPLSFDWQSLANLGGTLIFLMGVAHRKEISAGLIDAGMDPKTPVSAITWGTRADQVKVSVTLGDLGEAVVASPAVIVIGWVNSLDLSWFEPRPLAGLRVVVTRVEGSSQSEAERRYSQLGASVIRAASIEIAPPSDHGAAMDAAIKCLEEYEWLVFTSQNAVSRFFQRIPDLRRLAGVKIATVGPATESEVRAYAIGVDFIPSRSIGESLVNEFPQGTGKILFPRAKVARDTVTTGLADKGWKVDMVEAYQTVSATGVFDLEQIKTAHLVTFTSGSAVKGFIDRFGRDVLPKAVGSIGPITSDAARSLGIEVTFEAKRFDLAGLCDATIDWWGSIQK